MIRQVIEAAGGVFVLPGDDAALAEAVRWLSLDRAEAGVMGAARTYVVEHFNRADQSRAFTSGYLAGVNRRRSTAFAYDL